MALPLFSHLVRAGFPSPAADQLEKHISLEQLVKIHPPLIDCMHWYLNALSDRGSGRQSDSRSLAARSLEA